MQPAKRTRFADLRARHRGRGARPQRWQRSARAHPRPRPLLPHAEPPGGGWRRPGIRRARRRRRELRLRISDRDGWRIDMNPDWSLWRAQILAILRLEIKKNFLARRGLWIYLLAAAPAVLMWTRVLVDMRHERVGDLGRDSLIFAAMFQFFYLRLAVFFGCVGVFLKLFRGEMLEKSLHYYLLAPVRRDVLLVGKYLAGVVTTSIIFCTGTALTLAAVLVHVPRAQAEQYLFGGGGLGDVIA